MTLAEEDPGDDLQFHKIKQLEIHNYVVTLPLLSKCYVSDFINKLGLNMIPIHLVYLTTCNTKHIL